jgi:hypothetical protein
MTVTSGEAEGLPHASLDAGEILGGQEAERSLDDRLVHGRIFEIRTVLGC